MSIKVLVFESDAAFAGELRNELGKLGCSTCVVDDGTVGLQQASAERPDLILLSIELPRMNGFSVCNKLKKDASLKNVPLIIMSSESSDETFEQHRKLRTRAEDYVHKPIAFGELLQHIRTFVPMDDVGADTSDSDGIVIDDEISVQARIDLEEEGTVIGGRIPIPSEPPPKAAGVDADIDAFTESAFGMLQDAPRPSEPPPAAREVNGAHEGVATRPPAPLPTSIRPTRPPPNDAELGRLQGELERAQARVAELDRSSARVAELERELGAANEKIANIHEEADAEAERKQLELDELKVRLQQAQQPGGARTGGVSTREFLDLREALNKKDKEILALKEAVSSRDREIFEGRDKTLAVERNLAEAEEKIVAKERDVAELTDGAEELTRQLKAANAKSTDRQEKLDKTTAELQSTADQLADLTRKRDDENAAHEAAIVSVREELSQAKAVVEQAEERHKAATLDLESRHRAEIDEGEAKRHNEAEQARKDTDAALARAHAEADAHRAQTLATREKELRAEADAKLAALHRAHQDELIRAKSDAASQLEAARREGEERLTQERERAGRELAANQQELAAKHAEAMTAADARADARIAETQTTADALLADAKASMETAEEKVAELRRDLEAAAKATSDLADAKGASDAANEARITDLGGRIEALEAKLASESARLQKAVAKWETDKGTLERAKDALAVALSQIDEVEGRAIDQ